MPGVAFPPVGPLGLGSPRSRAAVASASPRYDAPLRLPTTPFGSLRFALASRYLARFQSFVVPFPARGPVEAPTPAPGPLVNRSPCPVMSPGDGWLSQVPELPLSMHAPLSDPGGVLNPRHTALRTAAFRPLETVGFPPRYALRGYPPDHHYTYCGAQSRGLHPCYTRLHTPPCEDACGFTPDLLARR